jgi:octopine/nopaline transport system permease protein
MGDTLRLLSFGPGGWGMTLAEGAAMTLALSACAYLLGLALGGLGAWGRLSGGRAVRAVVDVYTTVLRGIPDLLVIYLFYFGGGQMIGAVAHLFGATGFFGMNGFSVGTIAIGLVTGAYQTEVLRGGYLAIPKGEIEAARAVGMGRLLMLRRIIAPRALRFALPGMGNVWQQTLKESALVSVTGLAELMRQVNVASGSTQLPFDFTIAGFVLYLVLTSISGGVFAGFERQVAHGERAAAKSSAA